MKRIQITKHILNKWIDEHLSVHSDWAGSHVETIDTCDSLDAFVDKINAKKVIDDYKRETDDIVYTVDSLKIIFARLEAIYSCFPIKERQDFIIKILDLLRYGRRDANGGGLEDICGWYGLYSSQANYMKTKLKLLNDFYKEGKYAEVNAFAKEYNEQLEEFYVKYGIKEITVGENE